MYQHIIRNVITLYHLSISSSSYN